MWPVKLIKKIGNLFNDGIQFIEKAEKEDIICPNCGLQKYSIEIMPYTSILGESSFPNAYQKKCDNCGTIY